MSETTYTPPLSEQDSVDLLASYQRSKKKIEKHTDRLDNLKTRIENKSQELLPKLVELRDYIHLLPGVTVHDKKELSESMIKYPQYTHYDIDHEEATITIHDYDCRDSMVNQEIITFPFSLLHRTDWLQELQEKRDAQVKADAERKAQDAKNRAAQKVEEERQQLADLLKKYGNPTT